MEIKEQLDIKGLEQFYLFANTPGYLYRHFRSSETVSSLIERNRLSDLVDAYKSYTESANRPIENVVVAYAILMSFTFLKLQDALEMFSQVNLSRLDWGEEIKRTFESSIIGTTSVRIQVPPKVLNRQILTTGNTVIQRINDLEVKS